MSLNPTVSVVVPVRNEIENLDEMFRRLNQILIALQQTFEVLVVDNASEDGTRAKIQSLANVDARWKGIFLSRNFGHQNSLFCGLKHARGQVVISIDGDLQDPPEVITDMMASWRDGADVVSTVRTVRPGEPKWRITLIKLFYRVIRSLSDVEILDNSGDYRLMSRRALDQLLALDERTLFIRGVIPLIGFKQEQILYTRDVRFAGDSKMSFIRLLSFAIDGLVNSSSSLLRIATVIGVMSLVFSVGFGAYILFAYFEGSNRVSGWTTITLLIVSYGGAILLCLGLLGEYIGRIFNEVKRRPRFIVDKYVGGVERHSDLDVPLHH